jgi:8-oxo-dGTP pyrophosphatase MutT (NUDIX family)
MRSSTEVAPARPSSTVVLVRPGAEAPEIFMVKRHEHSSFGSAYAFPGGVLEDADNNVHDLCTGLTSTDASRLLQLDAGGLDYFSAAVRELFEEAGVLLGNNTMSATELGDTRVGLNEGALQWDSFTRDRELKLRCDLLYYFSFWITPDAQPKRYSTRFFLAEIPDGQQASHCGGELTDSCWLTANAALAASNSGDIRVHYPTRKTLESLTLFESVPALSFWAKSCGEAGVKCIYPDVVPRSER